MGFMDFFDSSTPTYSNTHWPMTVADLLATYKKIMKVNSIESTQEIEAALLMGYPVVIGEPFDPYRRAREQQLLRAASGRQDEYVWSDVLKCHVRIGEDLKL